MVTGYGVDNIKRGLVDLQVSGDTLASFDEAAYVRPFSLPRDRQMYWGRDPTVTMDEMAHDHYQRAKESQLSRVTEWLNTFLGRHKIDVLESSEIDVEVPVLYVAAPSVRGIRIKIGQVESRERAAGFEVTAYGTSLGATRSFALEDTIATECPSTRARLVSLRVRVLAERVAISVGNKKPKETLRCQALGDQRWCIVERTAKASDVADANVVETFDVDLLGDDSSALLHVGKKRSVTTKSEPKVGIEIGKVKVQMPFALSSARSIETSADLPGGRAYVGDWLTDPDGVRWSVRPT
jgi:hypothetical protein